MKTPAPGAKRYFFIPSSDGQAWDLAEATYRRRAWDVAYAGQRERDTMAELPPEGADWIELVPPGREPREPWPPLRLTPAARRKPQAKPALEPAAHVPPPRKAKAVPKKAIPGLSKELAQLLREQQMAQKAPAGMAKCPLCGAVIQPTKTKKVRTHDNPLTGARCDASNRPVAEMVGRPPRPSRN